MKTLKKFFLPYLFFVVIGFLWLSSNTTWHTKTLFFDQRPLSVNSYDAILPFLQHIEKKDSVTALFTPDDPVLSVLLHLINQERKSIKVAIFTFTEQSIAQALVDAVQRGVSVELVTDRTGILDAYSKSDFVYQKGVLVFSYNPQWNGRKRMNIMHHKFIIFEHTLDDASLVWTGSFNFTKNAWQANQENILIIKRKEVVKSYEAVFERLKSRSYVYRPVFIAH